MTQNPHKTDIIMFLPPIPTPGSTMAKVIHILIFVYCNHWRSRLMLSTK